MCDIKNELEKKLQTVLNIDEAIRQKELSLEEMGKSLSQYAKKITEGRNKQLKPLEEKVNNDNQ